MGATKMSKLKLLVLFPLVLISLLLFCPKSSDAFLQSRNIAQPTALKAADIIKDYKQAKNSGSFKRRFQDEDEKKEQAKRTNTINRSSTGTGASLNAEIVSFFTDSKILSPLQRKESIKSFFNRNKDKLTHVHVITLLHRSAKQKLDVSDFLPPVTILEIFASPRSKKEFKSVEIVNAMFGLGALSPAAQDVDKLFDLLTENLMQCTETFESHEICVGMYGLQRFDLSSSATSSSSIKNLLRALRMKIQESKGAVTGQEIGMALYGLRRMTSKAPEVRSLVGALARKIDESPYLMGANHLGFAFNGLQCMSCDDGPDVEDVVLALASKLTGLLASPSSLSSANMAGPAEPVTITPEGIDINLGTEGPTVSDRIPGAPSSSPDIDNKAVPAAVHSIIDSIRYSGRATNQRSLQRDFDGKTLGSLLQGLKGMNSDKESVRLLVGTLASALLSQAQARKQRFLSEAIADPTMFRAPSCFADAGSISNALNGLQSMNDKIAEVRGLTSVLAVELGRVDKASVKMTPAALSYALCGLKGFSGGCDEAKKLLSALVELTKQPSPRPRPGNVDVVKQSQAAAHMTSRDFVNMLFGLQGMNAAGNEAVRGVLQRVCEMTEAELSGACEAAGVLPMEGVVEGVEVGGGLSYGISGSGVTGSTGVVDSSVASAISAAIMSSSLSTSRTGTVADGEGDGEFLMTVGKRCSNLLRALAGASAEGRTRNPLQLSPNEIGVALYGLRQQWHKDEVPEVKAIMQVLLALIESSPLAPFTPQSAGMAMMGLRRMSSGDDTVDRIVAEIGKRLRRLDPQACCSVVCSMRNMEANSDEIRHFLRTLTPIVDGLKINMNAQEICNAFLGLSSMDSRVPEVVQLLKALTHKLSSLSSFINGEDTGTPGISENNNNHVSQRSGSGSLRFTPEGISSAISGFQTMAVEDDETGVIEHALTLWAEILEKCDQTFSPPQLAMILYGLQGMTSNSAGVRAVLIALVQKMKQADVPYGERDIGLSLVGLSTMRSLVATHEEVRAVVEELNLKLAQTPFGAQPGIVFMQFGKAIRLKGKK